MMLSLSNSLGAAKPIFGGGPPPGPAIYAASAYGNSLDAAYAAGVAGETGDFTLVSDFAPQDFYFRDDSYNRNVTLQKSGAGDFANGWITATSLSVGGSSYNFLVGGNTIYFSTDAEPDFLPVSLNISGTSGNSVNVYGVSASLNASSKISALTLTGINAPTVNVSGSSPTDGADGANGSSYTGSNGANGAPREDPGAGNAGAPGENSPFAGDNGSGGDGGTDAIGLPSIVTLAGNTTITNLYVDASFGSDGGNGGDGGNATGGNGGNGGDGLSGFGESQAGGDGGAGGNASAGGNGGDAGNGGNGVDASTITITLGSSSTVTNLYRRALSGVAGLAGDGGLSIPGVGGTGGSGANGGANGATGSTGTGSSNGTAGATGTDGTAGMSATRTGSGSVTNDITS